jgi:hypothetical protein
MTVIIQAIPILAVVLVFFSSLGLLIITNWRWSIVVLTFQYVGLFVLVSQSWPVTLALVKLVAGWMAGAIIGLALSNRDIEYQIGARGVFQSGLKKKERFFSSYRVFRLFIAGMVGLIILALAPYINKFLPEIKLEQSVGALFLMGFGILQLSLTTDLLLVILGLLTTLSGFEIIYADIESSSLVTALLATVTLGIALLGAYLLSIGHGDVSQ